MKIIVTGGTGMVGRNLQEYLQESKHSLLYPKRSELDLLSFENCKSYLSQQNPDMIIHCAGKVGGIQDNIAHPVDFLYQNLEMGKNIVMAAAQLNIPKLLNLASSCMYPKAAQNPLKESEILNGPLEPTNEGYALAKIITLKLCEYVNRENSSLDYKTLIPCNLFGKWDKFNPESSHLLPAIIKKISDAKKNNKSTIEIWGDGTVRREFMFAEDLCDFIAFAIDSYEKLPEIMNVGVGLDYSINEYYEVAARVIGFQGQFVHDLTKPVGMKQKLTDVSIQKTLAWSAKTSLEMGLEKTFQFYKERVDL